MVDGDLLEVGDPVVESGPGRGGNGAQEVEDEGGGQAEDRSRESEAEAQTDGIAVAEALVELGSSVVWAKLVEAYTSARCSREKHGHLLVMKH